MMKGDGGLPLERVVSIHYLQVLCLEECTSDPLFYNFWTRWMEDQWNPSHGSRNSLWLVWIIPTVWLGGHDFPTFQFDWWSHCNLQYRAKGVGWIVQVIQVWSMFPHACLCLAVCRNLLVSKLFQYEYMWYEHQYATVKNLELLPWILVSIEVQDRHSDQCQRLPIPMCTQVLVFCDSSLPMTVSSLSRRRTGELPCAMLVVEHELCRGSQAPDSSNWWYSLDPAVLHSSHRRS